MPNGQHISTGTSGLAPENLRRPMKSYPVTRGELYNLFYDKGLASVLLAVSSALAGAIFDSWLAAQSAGEEWTGSSYQLAIATGISIGILGFILISTYMKARQIERECYDPAEGRG